MTSLYPRRIEPRIAEALLDTPVVIACWTSPSGQDYPGAPDRTAQGLRYLTLDDELTLLSAREDPVGLLTSALQSIALVQSATG